VQLVGGLACGPNTVSVTVPPADVVTPDSVDAIELAAIAVSACPVAGAAKVRLDALDTAVEGMPAPQALVDEPLAPSPV
jgi:hypothetical protein